MRTATGTTQPKQELIEFVLETEGGDTRALEVDAGLATDWDNLTELFPFLLTQLFVPRVLLLIVELDKLLVILDSPTNWQLPDGWSSSTYKALEVV